MIWLPVLFALPGLFEGNDTSGFIKVPGPGVQYRMNMATATRAPWVDSNIWQYRRDSKKRYVCDVRKGSVALAMAEAFSQRVDAAMWIEPAQKPAYDNMLAFLKTLPEGPKTRWVDYSITDDGSVEAGEALKLLSRRNLMYGPGGSMPLKLTKSIADPYEFMLDAREKLGDEKRLLRIYGSEMTIAEVDREGGRVRLHLVQYGERGVEGMRLRIRGKYPQSSAKAYLFGEPAATLTDYVVDNGFTEFSLSKLGTYGVIDLLESR